MTRDSVLFGIAGIFFGILVGWMIGSQQSSPGRPASTPQASAQSTGTAPQGRAAAPLDESRAAALKSTAQQNPADAASRILLGNMYFDAERYSEATQWYEDALRVDPKNVSASTDLGITYYYTNQPDRALAQFDRSLALDPRHTKTLLNIGVVRAFGKQDLEGAARAWQKVIEVAPGTEEAAMARQALEGLSKAHPDLGPGAAPKPGGQLD